MPASRCCAPKGTMSLLISTSGAVRTFRISAVHPTYMGTLQRDSSRGRLDGLHRTEDPRAGPPQPPKRKTLYEDIEMWVVGLTFQDFWRPASATVRIGVGSKRRFISFRYG